MRACPSCTRGEQCDAVYAYLPLRQGLMSKIPPTNIKFTLISCLIVTYTGQKYTHTATCRYTLSLNLMNCTLGLVFDILYDKVIICWSKHLFYFLIIC